MRKDTILPWIYRRVCKEGAPRLFPNPGFGEAAQPYSWVIPQSTVAMNRARLSNFHQDTHQDTIDVEDSHVPETIPVPRNSAAPRNVETSSALLTAKLLVLSKTASGMP